MIKYAKKSKLPESPTRLWISCLSLGITVFVFLQLKQVHSLSIMQLTFLTMFTLAFCIISLEMILLKSFRRPSTGLDFTSPRPRSWPEIITRLIGFYSTLLLIAALYWLSEYYHNSFFLFYYKFLGYAVPVMCVLAIPYFIFLDRYQTDRFDGFWHMGTAVFLRFSQVNPSELKQHLLSWTVKAFFFPLMFTFLSSNINSFLIMRHLPVTALGWYQFLVSFIFSIDLLFAATGYACTLRLFDTHIRSVEPTLLGWTAALICYEPFVRFVDSHYLHEVDDIYWLEQFKDAPTLLFSIWGLIIITLLLIYVFSTLCFGTRFSNLTNRGILTNGPYSLCKHPAYVSKNLAWWLMGLPFLAGSTPSGSMRITLALMITNLIYYLRARTEERHLSRDPAYVAYAETMNHKSIFAWLGRLIPAMQFRQPH